ncbi:MAG: inositol monophosphatase family protein [Thermodesulforhabdaceae bacterium]|jgi:myo-inositol-1(or 4)-monophosphatase
MTREDPEILKIMEDAARQAGKLIASTYETVKSATFEEKSTFDYVTEVDRESERIIVDILKKAFPDDVIIAEESYDGSYDGEKPAWIIDPLDGTTNFIHGFPMVAVSIARLEKGIISAGCVFDPLRNEFFWAVRGQGAFMNGRKLKPRTHTRSLSQALVATGFPFRRKDLTEAYFQTFTEVFKIVSDIRRAGSAALDLTYVACGRLDGFWEVGLKPWDIAAAMLFIHETGGIVTDFWGRGEEAVLWNGNIVAASSPDMHKLLLEKVQTGLAERLTKS